MIGGFYGLTHLDSKPGLSGFLPIKRLRIGRVPFFAPRPLNRSLFSGGYPEASQLLDGSITFSLLCCTLCTVTYRFETRWLN